MAQIIITTDTDAEAVWFMELCRKMGQKLEVYFGDDAYARLNYIHYLEVQINQERVGFDAKTPFKGEDLARTFKYFKGKNRNK